MIRENRWNDSSLSHIIQIRQNIRKLRNILSRLFLLFRSNFEIIVAIEQRGGDLTDLYNLLTVST